MILNSSKWSWLFLLRKWIITCCLVFVSYVHIYIILYICIWRFPKIGVPPISFKSFDHFCRGLGNPPFVQKPPLMIISLIMSPCFLLYIYICTQLYNIYIWIYIYMNIYIYILYFVWNWICIYISLTLLIVLTVATVVTYTYIYVYTVYIK